MWTCPKCDTLVEPAFDLCWKCGTTPDGQEDPTFVVADDAPPIEDARYDPIAEPNPAIAGQPTSELVACYQALSLMEAKFLADQLSEEGIPAMTDTQDMQDSFGSWQGNPHVYCRADDLPAARAWLLAFEERRKAEHGGAAAVDPTLGLPTD